MTLSYRKKRNNAGSKPLTLSDGTEVYEITESFSVNSLIDISFSRSRPVRSRDQAEYQRLDGHIVEERIDTEQARLNYIGCTLIPPDQSINKRINATFNASENKLYKDPNKESLYSELPYVTYHNLTKKLVKFVRDLQKYNADDAVDRENIQLLTSGVKNLNNALAAINRDESYKEILSKKWRPYNNTNKVLEQTIANIMDPSSRSKQADDDKEEDEQREEDTWILYQQHQDIKTVGTSDCQFLDIESRVSELEDCIGFVTDMV